MMGFQHGRANLQAVISFGEVCGDMFSPGVNTLLDSYFGWILWHAKDDDFCFD